MRRIIFHRTSSLEDALEWKTRFGPEGRLLAGGTDLLIALRGESTFEPPVHVIDISRVSDLSGIEEHVSNGADGHTLRLGPLLTHAEIAAAPALKTFALPLARASSEIGSPQIRNRGTLGGNLINAAACADTVPPLLVLDAELRLRSVRGERRLPLDQLILEPYRTSLAPDEILTDIYVRPLAVGTSSSFIKLGRRRALSISRMSEAVLLEREPDGVVRRARIAAGSVAPTPCRFPEAESILQGRIPDAALLDAAAACMSESMIRLSGRRWSTPYKEPVIAALTRRALAAALGWRQM